MPVEGLLNLPCRIIHRRDGGRRDEYGNVVPEETPEDTRCWLTQDRRSVNTTEGEIATEVWRLYLAPGTTLAAFDRVIVDGESFEVTGPPHQTVNPRTLRPWQVEATLRRAV